MNYAIAARLICAGLAFGALLNLGPSNPIARGSAAAYALGNAAVACRTLVEETKHPRPGYGPFWFNAPCKRLGWFNPVHPVGSLDSTYEDGQATVQVSVGDRTAWIAAQPGLPPAVFGRQHFVGSAR